MAILSDLSRCVDYQSILRGAAASLFISPIPLIAPYTHFRAAVLPVINTAEAVKSKTRCQVARISNSGYGYLPCVSNHAAKYRKDTLPSVLGEAIFDPKPVQESNDHADSHGAVGSDGPRGAQEK